MNSRKIAHQLGLKAIREDRESSPKLPLARRAAKFGAIRPRLYNPQGMPEINQIVQGDCIKTLNKGPQGWVDLIFADPPFNIGYLYDKYNDTLKTEDYLKFSQNWMTAVHRALKPDGSFYLAIGDEYAADLCVIARRTIGFNLRNWIIWHYTFGQQPKNKFARSHTHILYFTKDAHDFTFNADAIRVASARQTTYGDSRANPKGKLPDDTWYLRPQEAEGMFQDEHDTWNVSRVCGTFKEREGWHGCQMPLAVLNRIVLASSRPGDIVLDPFSGSGTTAVAAALLGRNYVGIDQSDEYVNHARKRLAHTLEQAQNVAPAGAEGAGADAASRNPASAPSVAPPAAAPPTAKPDGPQAHTPPPGLFDPSRASKVMTATDAFGRPRVARARRARKAV